MRNAFAYLALLSLALCSGCGTIVTHWREDAHARDMPPPGPYRGVRCEAEFLFKLGGGGPVAVIGIPVIVDLPFSAIGDTVMLHHDLKKAKEYRPQSDLIQDRDKSEKWVPLQGSSDPSKWDEDLPKPKP